MQSILADRPNLSVALQAIGAQQRHVIADVGLPRWYWSGLAAAWIAIGVVSGAIVAVAILGFGPQLIAAARRRAEHNLDA
jgi:hypothetical protein